MNDVGPVADLDLDVECVAELGLGDRSDVVVLEWSRVCGVEANCRCSSFDDPSLTRLDDELEKGPRRGRSLSSLWWRSPSGGS